MTDPFPDVVRIEPVGVCNFRCAHCPIGVIGNGRKVMSLDRFCQIFNSLPAAPRVLVLYHGGEPLLNKDLEKMVKFASASVKKIVLNTNASLLTFERGLALDKAGLSELRISFDGDTAEDNDRIRRGSNFERDSQVVQKLAMASRRMKIVIYNVRVTGGEKPEPAGYLLSAFGDFVEYRTDAARVWGGLYDLRDEYIESPIQPIYCPNLWETFTILSNGEVVSCCEDLLVEAIYGNVDLNSPAEIWEQMQAVRDAFRAKEYPGLCRKCYRVTGAYLVGG